MSVSRGAVPSVKATNVTRSGFCLSRENRRAPRCKPRMHVGRLAEQRFGEGVAVLEAGKMSKPVEGLAVSRQDMGLVVGDHLQTMLGLAQKQIGGFEIGVRLLADPAAIGKLSQHRQRLAA